jgi:hypothetical protein
MKKVISILFSIIVLLSSMGITFSTHYCMGRAVDSALMIGMNELSCGMIDMDEACETRADGSRLMPPGCCDNDFLSIEIHDDYEKVSESISFDKYFLFAFSYAYLLNNTYTTEQTFAQNEIFPPPLEQDYQSLFQSFLL